VQAADARSPTSSSVDPYTTGNFCLSLRGPFDCTETNPW
jgi:hypothetical protein